MADVKIRKLPDYVVAHHKRKAEAAGRSLEEELRVFLTEDVMAKRKYWSDRLRKAREKISKRNGMMSDLTEIIREERERLG